MLYRILTEDKNYVGICELVEQHCRISGATVYHAKGFWQGTWENSLIIETDDITALRVTTLAKAIKKLNEQDAVLIQDIQCEGYLI